MEPGLSGRRFESQPRRLGTPACQMWWVVAASLVSAAPPTLTVTVHRLQPIDYFAVLVEASGCGTKPCYANYTATTSRQRRLTSYDSYDEVDDEPSFSPTVTPLEWAPISTRE